MIVVTFGDSDAGLCVTPWETVSLDVWLFIVVSGVWLVCVSSVLLGVCGEVEGSVDNDTFFEETAMWAVVVGFCVVLVVIFSVDEMTSVTVELVRCPAVVVISDTRVDAVESLRSAKEQHFSHDQDKS